MIARKPFIIYALKHARHHLGIYPRINRQVGFVFVLDRRHAQDFHRRISESAVMEFVGLSDFYLRTMRCTHNCRPAFYVRLFAHNFRLSFALHRHRQRQWGELGSLPRIASGLPFFVSQTYVAIASADQRWLLMPNRGPLFFFVPTFPNRSISACRICGSLALGVSQMCSLTFCLKTM